MFWQEDEPAATAAQSDDIVDVVFAIDCPRIPVDHAFALSIALRRALPWLEEEPLAGIHLIHAAGSQNGWNRPRHSPDELFHLSRRAKLTLRIPSTRMSEAERMTGATLDIAGHPLTVGKGQARSLSRLGTLFARHVASEPGGEEGFLHGIAQELKPLGVRIRKALCGIPTELHRPEGPLFTRTLLLADLPIEESLQLQRHGVGRHRLMGCGLFIPHKGIDPVNKGVDDGSRTPR